jgi:hypothetical protein
VGDHAGYVGKPAHSIFSKYTCGSDAYRHENPAKSFPHVRGGDSRAHVRRRREISRTIASSATRVRRAGSRAAPRGGSRSAPPCAPAETDRRNLRRRDHGTA